MLRRFPRLELCALVSCRRRIVWTNPVRRTDEGYQTRLEALRKDAAECALISDLATTPQKRVLWASLAAHLSTLAAEVGRAMGRSK